ncbi:MAG: conserved rane protein of unknown function [Gammaproteobacteria bacterium]|jgi:uncharacterized membrane protein YGL010W|nr:conserved rane protein of unknown function [Gammaproteobacteria bacterium]
MKTLAEQMGFYQLYHEKLLTKVTHLIGVPLLVFSFFIPLSWIKLGIPNVFQIDLAWLALAALSIYYLRLNFKIGISAAVVLGLLGWLAGLFSQYQPNWLGFGAFLISLVFGVALQFIGHIIEGKKPALADDLSQIFIAPIFLWTEVLFMLGYFPELKAEVLALGHAETVYP